MCTTPFVTGAQPGADANDRGELLRIVIATSLVNGLEIFDFTVFGFFAVVIGDQFFPAANPMTSLLLAVGTFGVGFFTRPLGATMIGAYADRVGRRAAMITTSWMMALGTAAIGFCPPFAAIGVAAPLIVIAGRLLQGFAAGGETGAAAAFLMEAGPVSRRGYLVSWQLAGQGAAALLGASLGALLTSMMSPASLASWGWRIPFLIGLLIAPVGLYVRRRLRENPFSNSNDEAASTLLAELYREHGMTIILATLMIGGQTVPFYVIVYYMPAYLSRVMHMPAITGFLSSVLAGLLLVAVSPLSGLLADRQPRRKPMVLVTSGCAALLAYPVFLMIVHAHSVWPVLCGVGIVSVLLALNASVGTVLVLEAFPGRLRASGRAVSYALGVALFGGTAQFIVTGLIKWTGDLMSAGWYVASSCLLGFLATALLGEQRVRT
jgi:MFS transporter, MHS family, proline/betaine transporter